MSIVGVERRMNICLLSFLLIATAILDGFAGARAFAQDAKSSVKVHTPGPSILSLAFEIAKEEGFYRQEAVDVELVTMASGAGVQALVAGSVDASQILGLTVRAAINRGAPLKVVMVFNDKPTYRLMTRKEIGSFADLKGKIVASSSPGASADALLQRLLEHRGLSPRKDMTIVYTGSSNVTYRALLGGSVHAAVLVPPLDALAKESDFRELADFAKEDLGPFIGGGVSVGDKFIRERADVLARFLRATWRAHRVIKTNRSASVTSLAKFMKLQTDLAEKIYDGSVGAFTENGFNSEDWQSKVLELEVGRTDKNSIRNSFDFSVLRSLK
jgi:NitT/TauT family transport system substrate-binding protein